MNHWLLTWVVKKHIFLKKANLSHLRFLITTNWGNLQVDRPTNQPMDGKNNRRTDGKTFKPYREARTHKREGNVIPSRTSFDQSMKVTSAVWVLFFFNLKKFLLWKNFDLKKKFCLRILICSYYLVFQSQLSTYVIYIAQWLPCLSSNIEQNYFFYVRRSLKCLKNDAKKSSANNFYICILAQNY